MAQERSTRPVRAAVAEKRRASERLKEEPASKKADSGTLKAVKTEKAKAKARIPTPEPEPPVEEEKVVILPSKIVDGQPLPTLKEPQASDLPDSEYKSLAESGVLAASIARSRQKWLHEGMFEKYWSKSVYRPKKHMTEQERKAEAEHKTQAKGQRPPMTKVGSCQMIIEPHIFDVTLYTVKDPTPQPPPQPINQPFVSYGPLQHSSVNTPASTTPTSSPYRAPPPQQTSSTQTHQEASAPAVSPTTPQKPPPNAPSLQPPQPKPLPTSVPPPPPPKNPNPPIQRNTPPVRSQSKPTSQQQSQQQRPDPVIHMLAQRAATDQELKQVMTIVATGKASAQQLEFFQRHIDELTKIARANKEVERKRKEAQLARTAAVNAQVQPIQAPAHPTAVPGTNGYHQAASQANSGTSTSSNGQQPSSTPMPQAQSQPRPSHPNQYTYQHSTAPKPPKPQPTPLHVLLEFSSNQVDRFLFPRNSILEYLPGFKSCVCSFLVVRKIKITPPQSTASSHATTQTTGKKGAKKEEVAKKEKEVYQPMTVKFTAGDANTLGILAKVVAPQEEVRKYMEDIMSRAERAQEGYLALRLPKRKAGIGLDGADDS